MDSKHTPGPWTWWTSNSWRRLRAESGRGHTVSVMEPFVSSDGHPNCTVSDPDMDLIGAAPDMLEALEAFVAPYAHLTIRQLQACVGREVYTGVSPHVAVSILFARAAIAKATGGGQ